MKTITATRDQLISAFKKWIKDAKTNQNNFIPFEEAVNDIDGYSKDCADKIIELLESK